MTKKPPSDKLKSPNLLPTDSEPSLLFTITELLQKSQIDFNEWFDEWKSLKAGKNVELSKYKQIKFEPIKPKFYDITPKDSKSGCKTIWFMPDGEEVTGIFLSGTDEQLIEHIVQLEYEGNGGGDRSSGKNAKPPLAGLPLLHLKFFEPYSELSQEKTYQSKGEKFIRCVGYTDDDRIASMGLAKKIKSSDVKQWAEKIVQIFSGYRWKKGQGCLSYMGLIPRYQGLETYAFCINRTEGKKLFLAMLKVFDNKPDESCFHWSEATNPALKFPKNSEEVLILERKIKKEQKRPIVDVVFDTAILKLTTTGIKQPLVKKNVVIYK